MSENQKHPYHLVDPSPWPLVTAISALIMAWGFIQYMHEEKIVIFTIGSLAVVTSCVLWWRDVISESETGGFHNKVVVIGLRYGMIFFIASEVMFFAAWFWAFFDVAFYPGLRSPELVGRQESIGGVFPPEDVELIQPFGIPLLNTFILLASGGTVTWAHHALRSNDRKKFLIFLFLTIILGVIFTALQAYEYKVATFSIDEGIYQSTFYMATGFHGVHVVIGTIFLLVCFIRGLKGHFKPNKHLGFEFAAWYWHFVDVVWLFLFTFIYWWASL
ncbi:MAG: cytochrome c oxidase subunit 3 [Rickettsiales bacterium]|nr:cytochrome c oxidase subunit 3 [Rickettsiales bacterium]|tara:strand:+ start:203 stop:1024 length:822 start_codon:yes stop_codon:yes gene_type:complete